MTTQVKSIILEGKVFEIRETHYLEYENAAKNSHKFWEISLLQNADEWAVYTRWGRIGANGQGNFTKGLKEVACRSMIITGLNEKLRKGYKERTSVPAQAKAPPTKKPKIIEVETEWDIG